MRHSPRSFRASLCSLLVLRRVCISVSCPPRPSIALLLRRLSWRLWGVHSHRGPVTRRAAGGRVCAFWASTGITNQIVLYLAPAVIGSFSPDAATFFPHSRTVILPPCFPPTLLPLLALALLARALSSPLQRPTCTQGLRTARLLLGCWNALSPIMISCFRQPRKSHRPSYHMRDDTLRIAFESSPPHNALSLISFHTPCPIWGRNRSSFVPSSTPDRRSGRRLRPELIMGRPRTTLLPPCIAGCTGSITYVCNVSTERMTRIPPMSSSETPGG